MLTRSCMTQANWNATCEAVGGKGGIVRSVKSLYQTRTLTHPQELHLHIFTGKNSVLTHTTTRSPHYNTNSARMAVEQMR